MFYKIFHAVSVTANQIFFNCEEQKEVSDKSELIHVEDKDIPHFKLRHFNRLQTSGSDKTKRLIEDNLEARLHRNKREHHHRSKEKKLLKAA